MSKKYILLGLILLLTSISRAEIGSARAFFSSQSSLLGNVFSVASRSAESSQSAVASPSATPQGTLASVEVSLTKSDTPSFYNLMSLDFQNTFSLEDLNQSLQGEEEIIAIEYLETPQSLGEGWYEQKARVVTKSGLEDVFNFILRQEDGLWRIYATEEV